MDEIDRKLNWLLKNNVDPPPGAGPWTRKLLLTGEGEDGVIHLDLILMVPEYLPEE